MKASRLKESDVHEAAQSLVDIDKNPSSLEIFKLLGRGSLTTITKHLKTFAFDEANSTEKQDLPELEQLPKEVTDLSQALINKIWAECHALASQSVNEKMQALDKVENDMNNRVKEVENFSNEQSKIIESQEERVAELEKQLKNKESLELQVDKLQARLDLSTNQIKELKQELKTEINNKIKSLEETANLKGQLKVYETIKPKQ